MRYITFRLMGKRVQITYDPASEQLAYFIWGIGMERWQVEDYWSFVLLDQIEATIDKYLDDENAEVWSSAYDAYNH